MNLKKEILDYINNYVSENLYVVKQFKPFSNSMDLGPFNYLPSYNQKIEKEDNPLNSSIVKDLAEKIYLIIFGSDKTKIKFDLKNHIKSTHNKNLLEIDDLEKKGFSLRYSSIHIMDFLEREVFIDMITCCFFKEEENLRLMNFSNNKIREIFESHHCNLCDESIHIIFNNETKTFELPRIKECPVLEENFNFNLKVSSKKLVIVNNLSEVFHIKRKDQYITTINSILGKILECKEYLKYNIAYISLCSGNLEVLKNNKEKKIVMDVLKENYYIERNEIKKDFKILGNIDLDLWGIFLLDYKHYKELCSSKGLEESHLNPIYIDVDNEELDIKYDLNKLLLECYF